MLSHRSIIALPLHYVASGARARTTLLSSVAQEEARMVEVHLRGQGSRRYGNAAHGLPACESRKASAHVEALNFRDGSTVRRGIRRLVSAALRRSGACYFGGGGGTGGMTMGGPWRFSDISSSIFHHQASAERFSEGLVYGRIRWFSAKVLSRTASSRRSWM